VATLVARNANEAVAASVVWLSLESGGFYVDAFGKKICSLLIYSNCIMFSLPVLFEKAILKKNCITCTQNGFIPIKFYGPYARLVISELLQFIKVKFYLC
jgi:hypothetical protein